MKRLLISIILLLSLSAFIYAQGETISVNTDDEVLVTFASNSKLPSINYYLDENKANKLEQSTYLNRDDIIYYDYLGSRDSLFDIAGFRVICYIDGERTLYDTVSFGDVITVPDKPMIHSISIEPYGEYRKRRLSLSDTADGIELDGLWRISDKVFTKESAEISPYESYYVSYEYDGDRYYLISAEPEKKVLSESRGSVLYNVENPEDSNVTDSYEIVLKPYTYLKIDEPSKIIEIKKDGKTIDPGYLQYEPIKAGESLEIATGRDYKIECSGAEVNEVQLLSDRRVFSLKVSDENRDYEMDIALKKQRTKVLDIKVEGPYSESADLSIRVNMDEYTLSDIMKGKEIIVTEGDYIYISGDRPDDNTRVQLSVDSSENSLDITDLDVMSAIEKSFSFDEIGPISIHIDKGYRFSDIKDNDQDVIAEYLVDGSPIKDGEFLECGTVVEIAVELPDHLKAKGLNIETGSDRGYVNISESTSKWDFQIKSEKRAGLYFDPKEYVFDNAELEFIHNGEIIKDRKFLENGTILYYSVKSVSPGYRLSDGEIAVDGEVNTRRKLSSIAAEEEMKVNVALYQPKYGGRAIYSVDGKVINEDIYSGYVGDIINIEYKSDNGWIVSSNAIESVRLSSDIIYISPDNAFIELDSHKSEFILTISPTVGDYFAVDVSSITGASDYRQYSERRSFIFRTLVPSSESFGHIPSLPFSLKLSGYSLSKREALKLTLVVKNKDGKEIRRETQYTKSDEYEFVYDKFSSDDPSILELSIEKAEVYDYEEMNIPNGVLTVKETGSGKLLSRGDMITPTETVTITLIADSGYYIYSLGAISSAISESKSYIEYISTFDDFIAKYQIGKWCSVDLRSGEGYESYSYYLNDKEVELGNLRYKEGDRLKLVYKVEEPYYIAGTLFSSRNTAKTITLKLSHDGEIITKDDFGIEIKEVGR